MELAVSIPTPILAPGGGRIVFFPAAHSGGAACREDLGSDVGFNTFAFLSFVLTVVNAIGWVSGDGAECHFREKLEVVHPNSKTCTIDP